MDSVIGIDAFLFTHPGQTPQLKKMRTSWTPSSGLALLVALGGAHDPFTRPNVQDAELPSSCPPVLHGPQVPPGWNPDHPAVVVKPHTTLGLELFRVPLSDATLGEALRRDLRAQVRPGDILVFCLPADEPPPDPGAPLPAPVVLLFHPHRLLRLFQLLGLKLRRRLGLSLTLEPTGGGRCSPRNLQTLDAAVADAMALMRRLVTSELRCTRLLYDTLRQAMVGLLCFARRVSVPWTDQLGPGGVLCCSAEGLALATMAPLCAFNLQFPFCRFLSEYKERPADGAEDQAIRFAQALMVGVDLPIGRPAGGPAGGPRGLRAETLLFFPVRVEPPWRLPGAWVQAGSAEPPPLVAFFMGVVDEPSGTLFLVHSGLASVCGLAPTGRGGFGLPKSLVAAAAGVFASTLQDFCRGQGLSSVQVMDLCPGISDVEAATFAVWWGEHLRFCPVNPAALRNPAEIAQVAFEWLVPTGAS